MMKIEILQDRQSRVTVPMVPNFIKLDEQYRLLSQFTPAQLKAIGEAWTQRLIERAGEQRRDGVRG